MKRSISLALIIFLLIGQTGFTFATHYCGDRAVKTSLVLGNELPSCGMGMKQSCELNTSAPDKGPLIKREPCCQNHVRTLEANKDLQDVVLSVSFSVDFDLLPMATPLISGIEVEENTPLLSGHSPPQLNKDIQVHFQTFLI